MGLKVTIDNAKPIDTGVWKATLKPDEAATFGDCASKIGPYTVLYLEAIVDFNARSQCLTFDPSATRLLNLGTTDQIIILGQHAAQPQSATAQSAQPPPMARREPAPAKEAGPAPQPSPAPSPAPTPAPVEAQAEAPQNPEFELSQALATGDKLFLSELPSELRPLGEILLSEVRSQFPGELTYEPRFAKFDETPEIFWTVKIMTAENSLYITVRGTPDDFKSVTAKGINLKLDKFGYSKFNLSQKAQVPGAVELIKKAAKNMMEL